MAALVRSRHPVFVRAAAQTERGLGGDLPGSLLGANSRKEPLA